MASEEGLRQRQAAFKDELARTKTRLAQVKSPDRTVKEKSRDSYGLADYGGGAPDYGGGAHDYDDAPGWPFYLGLFLLLFVVVFMGIAFFAPEWFESEPLDSFEDEY